MSSPSAALVAMTNGSFTPLAQMAGKEATYETLREIARRKPWFTRLEQEPWAALLSANRPGSSTPTATSWNDGSRTPSGSIAWPWRNICR